MRGLVNMIDPPIIGRCIRLGRFTRMAAGAADVNLTIFSLSRVHKRVRTACPSGPQNSPSQVGPPAAPQRIRPFATGIDVPPGLQLGGRIRSQTVCLLSSPLDDLCQVRSSYSHVDPRTRTTRVRSFEPIYRALPALLSRC